MKTRKFAKDTRRSRPYARAFARLKSRAGESISEVLIAVLVSAVGLVLLAGMITSASHLIQSSKEKIHTYADGDRTLVEKADGSVKEGTVVLKTSSGNVKLTDDEHSAPVSVVYYENPDAPGGDVISYKVK